MDARGKIKKIYPYEEMMTPYEKLKSLPEAHPFGRIFGLKKTAVLDRLQRGFDLIYFIAVRRIEQHR